MGQKKVAHQNWEILDTSFTTDNQRDVHVDRNKVSNLASLLLQVLFIQSSEIMQEGKTYRPGPSILRLVQNTVHQKSKSHLLSLEDGGTSPQEKNDATALYLVCWQKGPSDKEGILPLHLCKSNAEPDASAEQHLLIILADSIVALTWYLQRKWLYLGKQLDL